MIERRKNLLQLELVFQEENSRIRSNYRGFKEK